MDPWPKGSSDELLENVSRKPMQHITIIAVGKLKERFWVEACKEYVKRLSSYAVVEVKEVADFDPATCGGNKGALERESEGILKNIKQDDHVILLDIKGRQVSSEDIADSIGRFALQGVNDIVFVIGGSLGVLESVYARSNEKWSFGRITLPHNLARVVLLEQIYRAYKIMRNEPYHK